MGESPCWARARASTNLEDVQAQRSLCHCLEVLCPHPLSSRSVSVLTWRTVAGKPVSLVSRHAEEGWKSEAGGKSDACKSVCAAVGRQQSRRCTAAVPWLRRRSRPSWTHSSARSETCLSLRSPASPAATHARAALWRKRVASTACFLLAAGSIRRVARERVSARARIPLPRSALAAGLACPPPHA